MSWATRSTSTTAGLGLDVIAEGIENLAQRDMLDGFGCAHGQGFLFSRLLPADRIATLFEAASAVGDGGRAVSR